MDNLSDFDKQLIEWCDQTYPNKNTYKSVQYNFIIDFEDGISSLHIYVDGIQPNLNVNNLTSCFNGNLFVRIVNMRNGIKLIFSDGNNFLNLRKAINLLNIDFSKINAPFIVANIIMCSDFLESVKNLNLEFL